MRWTRILNRIVATGTFESIVYREAVQIDLNLQKNNLHQATNDSLDNIGPQNFCLTAHFSRLFMGRPKFLKHDFQFQQRLVTFGSVIVINACEAFLLGMAVESFSSWEWSCFKGFLLEVFNFQPSYLGLTFVWCKRQIALLALQPQWLECPRIESVRLERISCIKLITWGKTFLTCSKHLDNPDFWHCSQKPKPRRRKHVLLLKLLQLFEVRITESSTIVQSVSHMMTLNLPLSRLDANPFLTISTPASLTPRPN